MPKIGDVGVYHTPGGDKAAVVTELDADGKVGLAVLMSNTRHVEVRTWGGEPHTFTPSVGALQEELGGPALGPPGTLIEVDLTPQQLAKATPAEILESAKRVEAENAADKVTPLNSHKPKGKR